MRKIDLSNYMVQISLPTGEDNSYPYIVRKSFVEGLYHPDLRLGYKDLMDNDRLSQKIKNWEGDELLLEESEWERLKHVFETITGFTKQDVELVRRVMEAEKVEVKEK